MPCHQQPNIPVDARREDDNVRQQFYSCPLDPRPHTLHKVLLLPSENHAQHNWYYEERQRPGHQRLWQLHVLAVSTAIAAITVVLIEVFAKCCDP